MHVLNKFINVKISSARSVCSTLFEKFETFNALSDFNILIICFISFFKMCKSNDIVKNMNKFAISLTSV